MRPTSVYPDPGPSATLRQRSHYKIMAPLMEILREYDIKQGDFRKELINVIGEDITVGKVKSWFRISLSSGQLWTPPFGYIEAFDQALRNILTLRGYKFSPGARLYLQIAYPDQRTEAEKELIKQNRVLRLTIKELEEQRKEPLANS